MAAAAELTGEGDRHTDYISLACPAAAPAAPAARRPAAPSALAAPPPRPFHVTVDPLAPFWCCFPFWCRLPADAVRDLIGKAEATDDEWLVYFVLKAATLPVADALKERVMDALVHNQDKKENGGIAPWRRPLVVGDTPINHAEFMAVVLFLCDMVDKSSNLLGKGNTLTTVVEYGINMHVSDTVPTSMTHQFFAAMVSMCWIVAVFIPSYLWGTVRVPLEGVESSGRDAPSAEWRTDGPDGEGEDSSHRAVQSDVSDLDYLSVATAVFWALFHIATAQVASLTSTLGRANAAGLHSIELRWPEISAKLRASGKYEPTTARDFYQYLQLLRRHRLAYKIAAKLFIACAYGLMVSRGLRPAKCPCFHLSDGGGCFSSRPRTPDGGQHVPVLGASPQRHHPRRGRNA